MAGLGEFFYVNNIDFTQPDFFRIVADPGSGSPSLPGSPPVPAGRSTLSSPDLLLVGGGKDSAVSLEILRRAGRAVRPLVLNPTPAALENIRLADFSDPLVAKRTIDPTLLALNSSGYLNGHTPFSAYLAFLGLFVAELHTSASVMASNEASANEGNVEFHGRIINHQYSKSFRFEKLFRQYAASYLTRKATYFSLLRPLNELQISRIFAGFPRYFQSFRSCNAGSKTGSWCGQCGKCAFVYLSLFPFVGYRQMIAIFGSDFFGRPQIIEFIRQLVGLEKQKPFECVGTKEEAKLALALSVRRYREVGKEPPLELVAIEKAIGQTDEGVLTAWNSEHFVPKHYETLLRRMLRT